MLVLCLLFQVLPLNTQAKAETTQIPSGLHWTETQHKPAYLVGEKVTHRVFKSRAESNFTKCAQVTAFEKLVALSVHSMCSGDLSNQSGCRKIPYYMYSRDYVKSENIRSPEISTRPRLLAIPLNDNSSLVNLRSHKRVL